MREVERYLPGRCAEVSFDGRKGTLLTVLAAATMTGVSLWLITVESKAAGWFGAVFFGLCLLILLVQWVPGASGLRLEESGLRIRSLFTETTIAWSEVREFRLHWLSWRTVGLVFREGSPHSSKLSRALRAMLGVDGALPGRYGFRRKDLVRLLEAWRNHYTQATAPHEQQA